MKTIKKEYLKTEASLGNNLETSSAAKPSISYSSHRPKRITCTPLRFAEIKSLKNNHIKQLPSTKDRDQSTVQPTSTFCFIKHRVANAIDLFKRLGNQQQFHSHYTVAQISPFVLNNEDNCQEQISFRGVSNKLALLQKIDTIQRQTTKLLHQTLSLKKKIILPFSSQKQSKMYKMRDKIEDKSNFLELSQLIESIQGEISDFLVELSRCREIMKSSKGIKDKSVQLYGRRFQSLMEGLNEKMSCLSKYLDLTLGVKWDGSTKKMKIKVSKLNGS